MKLPSFCGDRCYATLRYCLNQLKDASTYRGMILVATALGVKFSPEIQEGIIAGGLMAAGLVGVIFPDTKRDSVTRNPTRDPETNDDSACSNRNQ